MPLLAVSQSLGLPDPVARVARPHWLFCETIHLDELAGMVVYRSTVVLDTDPIYATVADLLCRATAVEILVQQVIPDEGMMFGEAECSFYLLHSSDKPVDPASPGVREFIKLIETFKNPVHPLVVVDELVRRLGLDRIER